MAAMDMAAGVSMSTVLVFAMGMVAGFALALYMMKKCISTPKVDWPCDKHTEDSKQPTPEVTEIPEPGTPDKSTPLRVVHRKSIRVQDGNMLCFYLADKHRSVHLDPNCRNLARAQSELHCRELCRTCARLVLE